MQPTSKAAKPLATPRLIRSITIDRCSNFTSGGANGNDINLLSQLYKARTSSEEFISLLVFSVPDLKRISFEEAIQQEFRPTRLGEWFGPSWATHWFHVQVRIPNEFAGEEVHFIWNADNEALVWSMDGTPIQGFTGGAGSDARHEYVLTTSARGGDPIQFYIEMACNGMFGAGNGLIGPPDPNRFFNLNELDLAVPNKLAWKLLYDFQIILGMSRDLPQDSLRAAQALHTANRIVNVFRAGDDRTLEEGIRIASEFLGAKNGDSQHVITALGHCHIDTAWLWPFDETIRKAGRSWSTQIDLMDRYPDYTFVCSQAQQYEWVKDNYPKLWERIREKVTVGQFNPIGGTWVEMDCNIPSGESLVRQFLLGQRFFEEQFGKRCTVFWLPDTFGYSPQIPQLILQADMKYFFTQKLSWNNINKFPFTTFWWTALDGSRVITHMAPSETYNAQCTPEELIRTVRNHRDKEYTNSSLLVYGNGDGGGGPLAGMIERLKRMENVDGLAKVKMGSANEFYENIEKSGAELSSWKGELYFELHRGTYTTHAITKRYNRSCEFLLRELEILATLSMTADPYSFIYPKSEVERFWKMVCLVQFHDVLPGSAIEMVYDDVLRMHTEVDTLGTVMRDDLLDTVLQLDPNISEGKKGLAVFNSLCWPRTEIIEIPLAEGLPTMKQYSAFGRTGYALVQDVPAFGSRGYLLQETPSFTPVTFETDRNNNIIIDNIYIKATFDKSGHLVGLRDKAGNGRELIKTGERGNVFTMYEDVPLFWDAWDTEIYHLEKGRQVEKGSVQILEQGPLRVSLLIEKTISETSRLRQIVVITAISKRIDFETELDWNENRQFLKVEFAWNILTDQVTYETQFGTIQRPTHYNTSWESAKFEVVGHKFADMSEYGYGVALLNDCKYGYAAHENVVRLSLIRSPKAPDPNCDIGHHVFKYAVYPHEGHFLQSDVVAEGFKFNVPLLSRVVSTAKATALSDPISHFRIEGAPNVVLDTIKRAEDSDDVILRLYEAYGGHATARLITALPIKSIHRCNILEDEQGEPIYVNEVPTEAVATNGRRGVSSFSTNLRVLDDDVVEMQQQAQSQAQAEGALIEIKPFEIVTLKVNLRT
ncbi:galactose mutarotase-like domain-containing protein [Umbelopsis sp. AD052]|nr:galactose mutarotase-like domain-containing protein [Umbelopsis sp. AD052]